MTNALGKVGQAYRAGGISSVLTGVKNRLTGHHDSTLRTGLYQDKVSSALDLRWSMISAELPSGSESLLDIGCNLGGLTSRAASAGLWCLGIEQSPEAVKRAREINADISGLGFVHSAINLNDCRRLPIFDVMLVLSVHHHWHFTYGQDDAAEMLLMLAKKTRKVMFFEGPSRSTRYEKDIPDYRDNDDQSVKSYFHDYLSNTVGAEFSDIKLLGSTPCVGVREPHRWLFALHK